MTDLRHGSPEYLALLDSLTWYPDAADPTWRRLDDAWAAVCDTADEANLYELARVAMALVARETVTPLADLKARAALLHVAKNAGYAGADQPDAWANFRMSAAFGISPFDGVLVRLSDKYIRCANLRRDPSNERIGESLVDTLFDLSAYALIAICLMREDLAA